MVAQVQGRSKPHNEERDRWEQVAAAQDEAKWAGLAANHVAKARPGPETLDERKPRNSKGARGFK
jgi:hypothetical protein